MSTHHVPDRDILIALAKRLTFRGTKPSRGVYHQRAVGRPWYTPEVRARNRREWRHVAFRWLRRYVGGDWYVGGHHVGRPDYGPAIVEVPLRYAMAAYPELDTPVTSPSRSVRVAIQADGRFVCLILDERRSRA